MKVFLSLLLFFIFLVPLKAQASWTPNAWPSTNHFHFTDTNSYLLVTNYWSKLHIDNWSQESTGTNIPEVLINFGPFGDISSPISTASRLIPSLDFWEYNEYIGPYTNNTRQWTNEFIFWTQAEIPTNKIVGNGQFGLYFFTYPLHNFYDGWLGRTNGTSSWTNTYNATNEYEYTEEVVVGQVTNIVTNVVTTILSGSSAPTNSSISLDVPFIWAHDTYLALRERWQFRNPTNDFFTEGPAYLKPLQHGTETLINIYDDNDRTYYRSYRDVQLHNLNNFKIYIYDQLMNINEDFDSPWVDKTKADTNGLFETYFNDNRLWEFVFDPITFSNKWQVSKLRESFPKYKFEEYSHEGSDGLSFTNLAWFPHEISTNVFTGTVTGTETPYIKGWQLSPQDLFVDAAPTGSVYVITNLSLVKTWFDWTPYDDVGGHLPMLSNVVEGTHSIPIDMTLYPTTAVYITDSCGGLPDHIQGNLFNRSTYYYYRLHQLDITGAVSSVDFSIYEIDKSNPPMPDILIHAESYATNTVYTNSFICTNSFVAKGFTEADYGYAIMPQMVDLLHWTANPNFMSISNIWQDSWSAEPNRETNTFYAARSILNGQRNFYPSDASAFPLDCSKFILEPNPTSSTLNNYETIFDDTGFSWLLDTNTFYATNIYANVGSVLRRFRFGYDYFEHTQGSEGFFLSIQYIRYLLRDSRFNPPLTAYPPLCECTDDYFYGAEDDYSWIGEIFSGEWYNLDVFASIRSQRGEPFETNLYTEISAESDLYRFESSVTTVPTTNSTVNTALYLREEQRIFGPCVTLYNLDFFTVCEEYDCPDGYLQVNAANGPFRGVEDVVYNTTNEWDAGRSFFDGRASPEFRSVPTQLVYYASTQTKGLGDDDVVHDFSYPFLTDPSESNLIFKVEDFVDEDGDPIALPIIQTNYPWYGSLDYGEGSQGNDSTKFKNLIKWDFEYQYEGTL